LKTKKAFHGRNAFARRIVSVAPLTPVDIELEIRHSPWWVHQDSNLGPAGYEPVALTAELWTRTGDSTEKNEAAAGSCFLPPLFVGW
jgi:hypothetical protein